jgi:hypothetical protein
MFITQVKFIATMLANPFDLFQCFGGILVKPILARHY